VPKTGEIKQAKEIGYKGYGEYIWLACIDCGKERWVALLKGKPRNKLCPSCSMTCERGSNWKGGKAKRNDGYIQITLSPNNFFYPMTSKKHSVLEHRLIMAQHLGRCLHPWELVHHKDGIRDHNALPNLTLTTRGSHNIEHNKGYRDGYQEGYLDGQNGKIEELRKEIKLLQWQIKELNEHIKVIPCP